CDACRGCSGEELASSELVGHSRRQAVQCSTCGVGRSWGVSSSAWRRLFQRLFCGLSLAAGTIHTDTTRPCWNNSIRTALNRKLSQCVCVEGAGLIPGPTIVLRGQVPLSAVPHFAPPPSTIDRKSTRLNSSHQIISYAVFCLKKKI